MTWDFTGDIFAGGMLIRVPAGGLLASTQTSFSGTFAVSAVSLWLRPVLVFWPISISGAAWRHGWPNGDTQGAERPASGASCRAIRGCGGSAPVEFSEFRCRNIATPSLEKALFAVRPDAQTSFPAHLHLRGAPGRSPGAHGPGVGRGWAVGGGGGGVRAPFSAPLAGAHGWVGAACAGAAHPHA